jgi:hypothetical protein
MQGTPTRGYPGAGAWRGGGGHGVGFDSVSGDANRVSRTAGNESIEFLGAVRCRKERFSRYLALVNS